MSVLLSNCLKLFGAILFSKHYLKFFCILKTFHIDSSHFALKNFITWNKQISINFLDLIWFGYDLDLDFFYDLDLTYFCLMIWFDFFLNLNFDLIWIWNFFYFLRFDQILYIRQIQYTESN
jgi:hypothetical protein